MYIKIKLSLFLITCIICILVVSTECKRGGGGRRGGTYRGSSSVWSKSRQSQTASNYDLYGSNRKGSKSQPEAPKPVVKPDTPKASAPPSPKTKDAQKSSSDFINQEKTQNVQQKPIGFEQVNKNVPSQTNNQQRPIGWDVKPDSGSSPNLNKNSAYNVGHGNPSGVGNPTHVAGQQSYPTYNSYPGQTQAGAHYYGSGQQYQYGNTHTGYQPQQQFSGYQPNPAMGGMPQQTPNTGLYHNNMGYSPGMANPSYGGVGYGAGSYSGGGYGGYGGGGYGGYGGGGYGGYGGGGYGGYGSDGSLFGRKKHGFGGFGGFGGSGIGGYGKKYGGGFGMGFGKNAYRNAFFGLLIWNLVSGLTRRPYYVYNYYNNPEKIPEEIPVPANVIVLCSEGVSSLCAPNTVPLCTSNNTILCVVLAQETVPCKDNPSMKCVNSTVSCKEGTDDNCKELTDKTETTAVNVPCVTNATVVGKINGSALPFGGTEGTTNLCVTTLAVEQPEEDIKAAEAAGCGPNAEKTLDSKCIESVSPDVNNGTVTNLNGTVTNLNGTVTNLNVTLSSLAM